MERSRIGFAEALAHLHGLIGTEVSIVINAFGRFLGAGFSGTLLRVESLPPDDAAIHLVLDGGQGLHLDPADVEAALLRTARGEVWLEFSAGFGLVVTIEPAQGRLER